ncbi:MAG: hypothetical protein ACXAD7_09640 [Candidatus Kariarchaeaceae archaeon]
MLTIIATKLLLDGAIKTFIVKPLMSSTLTLLPQKEVIQATLLDHNLLISTMDLLKFGVEKLYDRFVGKKLDFQVKKLEKYIFGVSPADEFAALFSKDYADDQELIIDLSKFEDYLDSLYEGILSDADEKSSEKEEVDQLLHSIIEDLDLAINLSPNAVFDDINDEKLLVDEILQKNLKQVKPANFGVSDFPNVPVIGKNEGEEINEILAKFLPETPKEKKKRVSR